ncbi:ribonuclease Z [Ureibacillus sp. Re31]|uniref:Ribonuclease Z n=1 Tax=Ureibacillus galli TaxID=2762222 RepID=A0ABR8XFW8_9BACL|nr:MBL fold metallo-hydrolase [Ureibacillus galli]MBD8028110.1 ribonuclease Z [Ureibacillus galli]
MEIIPLGVGGAFTTTNYHNNYIIHLNEKYLLIDAGSTLRFSLREAGYHYTDIDAVFISHLHFDHVGGLEEMIMQRFWQFKDGQHSPLKTTIIVHEKLLTPLKRLLCHGLANQGRTVEDFCEFICLKEKEIYKIEDYSFTIFDTSNTHAEGLLSFGFKLASLHANIVFTSDVKRLKEANILGHVDDNTVAIFQDVSFTFNGVHATLEEVLDYYPNEYHSKLYAMHYNDNIEEFRDKIVLANINIVKKGEFLHF